MFTFTKYVLVFAASLLTCLFFGQCHFHLTFAFLFRSVYTKIPGGQYTNLLFQSKQLGLTDKWPEIKQKYALANIILGDIPKVTPSSKVVGDLAQFMVSQNLNDAHTVVDQAETLAFPDSVVQYLRGDIGIPPGGFPEPLRTKVLQGRGLTPVNGRPGQFLPDYNFKKQHEILVKKYGEQNISEKDILSYALYPDVYTSWKDFQVTFGEVGNLPTHVFLNPMQVGEEIELMLEPGKQLMLKLVTIEGVDSDGRRNVLFEVNGEPWYIPVTDQSSKGKIKVREKCTEPNHIGAPMPGVVVDVKVHQGLKVKEGETVATLSAMKMETSIPASTSGE
jgi:pyruvate carboxylase